MRRDEQMDVVRYEDIGMQVTVMALASGSELGEVEAIIVIRCEDRLAVVPPLNDMLGMTWQHKAR
jgi:hypothetical protein